MGSPGSRNTSNVSVGGNSDVMSVNDLHDGSLRDPVFEGLILNRYGSYDRKTNKPDRNSPSKTSVINADVTDRKGFTTVTVVCYTTLSCQMFSDILQPNNHVRISNFVMKPRNEKNERGDIQRSLRIDLDSIVVVIQEFVPRIVLKFFHFDSIRNFKKKLNQRYSYGNLSVTVFEALPEREEALTVRIADGVGDPDIFILDMEPERRAVYDDICEKMLANVTPVLHLKNVVVNSFGVYNSFKIDGATVVTEVYSEKRTEELRLVFDVLFTTVASVKEVTGVLRVSSPSAPPFKIVCSKCHYQNIVKHTDDTVFCNCCKNHFTTVCIPHVTIQIMMFDEGIIPCFATGKQLEQLIDCKASEFLDYDEERRIELLSRIELNGNFKINPRHQLSDICPIDDDRFDMSALDLPLPIDVENMTSNVANTVVQQHGSSMLALNADDHLAIDHAGGASSQREGPQPTEVPITASHLSPLRKHISGGRKSGIEAAAKRAMAKGDRGGQKGNVELSRKKIRTSELTITQ